MKKVVLVLCIVLLSGEVFAQTSTSNLPAAAKNYIENNFEGLSISEIKENSAWQIWEDEKFEVTLSNGVEIDFDENGNALEIESKSGEVIPLSALPEKVAEYIAKNYPATGVIAWEKSSKEHEVELVDGQELIFDQDSKFVKID